MKRLAAIVAITFIFSSAANADLSWGLGYYNPPRSTLGANLMWIWNHVGLEAGAGFNHQPESGHNSMVVGANGKYLFTTGFIRPFLQAGAVSSGSSTDPYAGAGLLMVGFKMNLYFGLVYVKYTALQLGIGFP